MIEPKHTIAELQQWQALPLETKVLMTKERIRNWVNEYGLDGVYVSFSGGKDSTVLLDIAREMYGEDVKGMFVNTGLEYPEIVNFVKTFPNIDIVRPKMNFKQVIEKYGYPFFSKEVSECLYGARKYLTEIKARQTDRQTDRQITSLTDTGTSVLRGKETTANFPHPLATSNWSRNTTMQKLLGGSAQVPLRNITHRRRYTTISKV